MESNLNELAFPLIIIGLEDSPSLLIQEFMAASSAATNYNTSALEVIL